MLDSIIHDHKWIPTAALAAGMLGWTGLNILTPRVGNTIIRTSLSIIWVTGTVFAAYVAVDLAKKNFQRIGENTKYPTQGAFCVVLNAATFISTVYLFYKHIQSLRL